MPNIFLKKNPDCNEKFTDAKAEITVHRRSQYKVHRRTVHRTSQAYDSQAYGSRIYTVHRRSQGWPRPPTFLTYLVILCFERRHSKQNIVIRLKSNILASPNFWPPKNIWAGYVPDTVNTWLAGELTCFSVCVYSGIFHRGRHILGVVWLNCAKVVDLNHMCTKQENEFPLRPLPLSSTALFTKESKPKSCF